MHTLIRELVRRCVRVLLVGCGGSGSAVGGGLPYLHQAMLVAGHPGGLSVTIMDGDLISATNCVRQPFCSSEIGLSKAVVLVNRLNLFWGLRWTAAAEHLTTRTDTSGFDVIIGCVDTRKARRLIKHKAEGCQSRAAYYIDLGNTADCGQVVLGQPLNGRNRRSAARLRTAPEIFPELVADDGDDDGAPTCSAVESIERQEPFVNHVLAYHALALLTRLFRYGTIEHHGAFVNVRENRVLPIPIDPVLWRRMRQRGRRSISARPA